jgi:hypothetical protein
MKKLYLMIGFITFACLNFTLAQNLPPVIDPIPNQNMDENDTLVVLINAVDPESDNITLSVINLPWFGVLTDNGDGTGFITFIPGLNSGSYPNIEVVATDDGTPVASSNEFFRLTVADVIGTPVIDPIDTQNMNEGSKLVVPINVVDPDGDAITISVNNLPSFGAFTDNGDGTGDITFLPSYTDAGTYNNIRVIATDDGVPSSSSTEVFRLNVADMTGAPVIHPISDQYVNEGDTLVVPIFSSDPEGDAITLIVPNLTSFGVLTDNGDGTGFITFTPGYNDNGTYYAREVRAKDDGTPPLIGIERFKLTVGDVNGKPVLDPIADQNMNEGDSLGVAVNSTDPDGDNITLTVNNLPSFGSFTDNGDGTGSISFLPGFGEAGSYPNIEVVAADDGTPGLSDTTTFTLTVGDVNRAPVLDPITDQNMNEGDSLDVAVNSTDPDGDNITLTTANLPSFGSFTDNGDGTGMFSFLPAVGDSGSYPDIEVIATDDGTPVSLTDTVRFALTVGIEAIIDPTDLIATALVVDQVELGWTDNSNNEEGFIIERETPAADVFQVIDTVAANTVSYIDVTVSQGKRYNYQVKGFNAFTESGYAGPAQVVTILPAPSDLVGLIVGPPSAIQLNWVDNSNDELGFAIERDSANSGFVLYDTVGTNNTSYIDTDVVLDTTYIYRVFAFTADTISSRSDTVHMVIPTDISENNMDITPTEYVIYQNYPNPFNPSTKIRFALPFESKVKLEIYNAIGELVKVLVNNETMEIGYKEVEFNASNIPSGVYFYRIIATNNTNSGGNAFVETKKMILLK